MCLISGGNWNNNTNAGVWNVNLNNYRTNSNNNIGFRSADFDSFIFPKILTVNDLMSKEHQACLAQKASRIMNVLGNKIKFI